MQQSVVYSNGNQECERAVSLLRSLGHDFHEYMVGEALPRPNLKWSLVEMPNIRKLRLVKSHVGDLKETLQEMFLKT